MFSVHLKKKCPAVKAKLFNQKCKPFDFSKCRQVMPVEGSGSKDEESVDDPDILIIDSPTPPEVQKSNAEDSFPGFSGESTFGPDFGYQTE